MHIGKTLVKPMEGSMELSDDSTWFEIDDSGSLKIKSAMQKSEGMEETAIILNKKLTERLKEFLN